jgi:hypothetical protein
MNYAGWQAPKSALRYIDLTRQQRRFIESETFLKNLELLKSLKSHSIQVRSSVNIKYRIFLYYFQ